MIHSQAENNVKITIIRCIWATNNIDEPNDSARHVHSDLLEIFAGFTNQNMVNCNLTADIFVQTLSLSNIVSVDKGAGPRDEKTILWLKQ